MVSLCQISIHMINFLVIIATDTVVLSLYIKPPLSYGWKTELSIQTKINSFNLMTAVRLTISKLKLISAIKPFKFFSCDNITVLSTDNEEASYCLAFRPFQGGL